MVAVQTSVGKTCCTSRLLTLIGDVPRAAKLPTDPVTCSGLRPRMPDLTPPPHNRHTPPRRHHRQSCVHQPVSRSDTTDRSHSIREALQSAGKPAPSAAAVRPPSPAAAVSNFGTHPVQRSPQAKPATFLCGTALYVSVARELMRQFRRVRMPVLLKDWLA